MNANEKTLRQAGFSELACQFSRFIARLDGSDDDIIAMTAALVTDAVSQGHVCLNLQQVQGRELLDYPDIDGWKQRLRQSVVVGKEGEYTPLILTDDGRVYLYRYWLDEQHVANAIIKRCQSIELINPQQLKDDFAAWPSQQTGIDWQKIAVLMALTRQFSVISGGPGTGKTTIVLRLLQMLHAQDPSLSIALAAPTGKAAARLQQAISEQGRTSLEAKTLHRLLGINAHNENGRYNSQQPLPVDVLIIDEASMIDISLMAKLMQALPDKARIILLGDSQQLASVESGAVLANLCDYGSHFSATFCQTAQEMTGLSLSVTTDEDNNLRDSIVLLQHSYRFDKESEIGQLAEAVKSGEINTVYDVLNNADIWQQQCDANTIQQYVMQGYQAYFSAIKANKEASVCLQLFEQYRVLSALKQGPQSVTSVNKLIETNLLKQGWKTNQTFYHGRPIMVVKNDYQQRLFNGDVGLLLYNEHGVLQACFLSDTGLRWVALNRLPTHETVFAMTIHKSQGSEFDTVCVLLPEEETALLNRELLYTAVTRAKKKISLFSSDMILHQTVTSQHQRETGLANLLSF
ncbi:MAG: exodeoxyribonuclease V subunit alpha [Piscirickettsiaceae bacterium]|nr:exodeoxyribonuclease V subunit alpha [Piscirickettsiaceae bacterium]